ncbi:MAG: GNAT family N-acetyltransferase [Clostridia bacterium]
MQLLPIERIETNRLYLRKLTFEDIPLYYARLSSSYQIPKYMLWSTHEKMEQTIDYVRNSIEKYASNKYYKWVIALKQTNELIGIIELLRFDEKDENCSFAYMLAEEFWNKGYMTEALQAALHFAFMKLEVKEVIADHFSENLASGKVMKKVGMQYIGRQEQTYQKDGKVYSAEVYKITKQDFLDKNKN